MGSPQKKSIKACEEGITFFQNLRTNRRKADVDKADLSYWRLIKLISKYFRLNNSDYLKLVQMEE